MKIAVSRIVTFQERSFSNGRILEGKHQRSVTDRQFRAFQNEIFTFCLRTHFLWDVGYIDVGDEMC